MSHKTHGGEFARFDAQFVCFLETSPHQRSAPDKITEDRLLKGMEQLWGWPTAFCRGIGAGPFSSSPNEYFN